MQSVRLGKPRSTNILLLKFFRCDFGGLEESKKLKIKKGKTVAT